MNLEDYIKLRFFLNNQNYKELPTNAYLPDTTIIEKNIFTEDKEFIKYSIKYYLKQYAFENDKESMENHQFGVNVSVILYIKNHNKELDNKAYIPNDSLNMNYYMATFKEPNIIEGYVETIWNTLSIFDNYPFKGYY